MTSASLRCFGLALAVVAVLGCGGGNAPTAPPAVPGVEVWAVGDGPDGSERPRRVAELIARARPDRVLYLGDVYERTVEEEERGEREARTDDERQDRGFKHFAADYGRLLPVTLPTPGNHDGGGYYRFWERRGRPARPWYRVDVGGWSLLALNSEAEYEARSEQLRWLRRQLAAPGTCRLAFWHSPRFSAGKYDGAGDHLDALWSALVGRATLVLNGHDHNMQRLRPVDGITVLISGAGGHGLHDVDEDDPDLAFAADDRDGALRLELSPGRARFAFVGVDATVLDAGELLCRQG